MKRIMFWNNYVDSKETLLVDVLKKFLFKEKKTMENEFKNHEAELVENFENQITNLKTKLSESIKVNIKYHTMVTEMNLQERL